MSKNVVFVADDFGLSDEVNAAIVHAHRRGALNGASLMLGQPATAAAVTLARENPQLQIGWHLHLNDSQPCTLSHWPWRRSPAAAGFAIGLSPKMRGLARREVCAQWAGFCETGLPCHFVNAHHHLHLHPFIRKMLVETLPVDFSGWVRWGRPRFFDRSLGGIGHQGLTFVLQAPRSRRMPFRISTTLWGLDRTFNMQAREIAQAIPELNDGLHEFMFHPRGLDSDPDTGCLLELARDARRGRG
jgi:predicted glycoside hydrolase/deacetylase ChbG (UPF0249 family)